MRVWSGLPIAGCPKSDHTFQPFPDSSALQQVEFNVRKDTEPERRYSVGRSAVGDNSHRSCGTTVGTTAARKTKGPRSFDLSPSISGAPGRIRTHDPLVRSQVLYPTELRALLLALRPLIAQQTFQLVLQPTLRDLHPARSLTCCCRDLAETVGFEPTMQVLPAYSLSRGAPSASRSRLRRARILPLHGCPVKPEFLMNGAGPDRTPCAGPALPAPCTSRRPRPKS